MSKKVASYVSTRFHRKKKKTFLTIDTSFLEFEVVQVAIFKNRQIDVFFHFIFEYFLMLSLYYQKLITI
jgi:hypothetical protein